MARIGIIGSEGRMGQASRAAVAAAGHDSAGGIDWGGDASASARASDVMADFSAPAASEGNLDAAVAAGVPIVIGTTGSEERHHFSCDAAADAVAVLQTGNTSSGVTSLAHSVREAASRSGEDWDIEIVETHHRMKVDAPSGTASSSGEAAAKGRAVSSAEAAVRGRDGITGARQAGTIGFASSRGGTVAGDHTVHFSADNERAGALKKDAIFEFFRRSAETNPDPQTESEFGKTCRESGAVVSSAQATDVGVNKATRASFRDVKTPQGMIDSGEEGSKQHVKTIGSFNAKARNVIASSEISVR
ncbi:hypothetical protein OY671_007535, partial [Metschnikowia pulcherrima]